MLVSFPDIPEASTKAAKEDEAQARAQDCLVTTIGRYVTTLSTIPRPSPACGRPVIALPAPAAAKVALYVAMCGCGIDCGALAAKLGLPQGDVRDLIDLDKPSNIHEIEAARDALRRTSDHGDNTFEVGLVLAGAVSAGAYTAGVMDFLFEALDEWYGARCKDDGLPNHNVVVSVISGASAGGINGAIAAAACRYHFPPIKPCSKTEDQAKNPFFRVWVDGVDIGQLLDSSDLERGGPARSVLNSEPLDELAQNIVNWKGCRKHRPWLADPFKLFLTVTNLRGVPYEVRFSGDTGFGHEMILHRDHIGFLVRPQIGAAAIERAQPDLVLLPPKNSAFDPEWKKLKEAALASGAFPLALPARSLSRPASDYCYRFVFHKKDDTQVHSKPSIPKDDPYCFNAVDGGTMNNEPFELARVVLAGSKGRNPRRGCKARRAVVMVDPFTEPQSGSSTSGESLLKTFQALLKAFKAQSRFHQIDLTLAEAEDVYSRFLIAPSREGLKGRNAIASGGLGGFLGFFCRDYRLHDYMLGRENCQRFLRDWFVLPSTQTKTGVCSAEDNPLFKNWTQAALNNQRYKSKSKHRQQHRQIIPLVGTAAKAQTPPCWPRGKFCGHDKLEEKIKMRIGWIYPLLAEDLAAAVADGQLYRLAMRGWLWIGWKIGLKKKTHDKLRKWIDGARDEVNARFTQKIS